MTDAELSRAVSGKPAYQPAPTLAALNGSAREVMTCWRRVTVCPACASGDIRPFANLRHISYGDCRACGFTFANTVPPDEFLAEFYNSSFYGNYRTLEADRIRHDRYFSISSYTDPRRLASWIKGGAETAI